VRGRRSSGDAPWSPLDHGSAKLVDPAGRGLGASVHARRDQIVSFAQSVGLREDWHALGADVRLYVTRGGLDHISGALAGTPVALDWLARRLSRRSGEPRLLANGIVEPAREAA
jgi:hypothetical protein